MFSVSSLIMWMKFEGGSLTHEQNLQEAEELRVGVPL